MSLTPITLNQWSSYLESEGASLREDGLREFPSMVSKSTEDAANHLYDLSQLGCLWVEGKDAEKFLQGQLTCDLQEITLDQFRRGAICNLQGRMLCSLRAVKTTPESYALLMHRGLIELVREWLAKYIIFSKASLRVDNTHTGLGFSGEVTNPDVLGLMNLPTAPNAAALIDHGFVLGITSNRWLIWIEPAYAEAMWRRLAPKMKLADFRHWSLQDIRDGLAEVEPTTAAEFIPQMVNLQNDGGVSFKKGCYIGQEVVARMQYLGKLKRHCQHVKFTTPNHPKAGNPLFVFGESQSVGNIINVAPTGPDTFEALVVVTDAAREANAVYLAPDSDEKLHFISPPYAITK